MLTYMKKWKTMEKYMKKILEEMQKNLIHVSGEEEKMWWGEKSWTRCGNHFIKDEVERSTDDVYVKIDVDGNDDVGNLWIQIWRR